ncbi:MAG: BlaI/MecI/CopY family transcriptional regulator [Oscillospiraceae bacterium]|nr:BlaI/MecI/CopY family transcriptional regulator [Oscillospiraceae bacterium]
MRDNNINNEAKENNKSMHSITDAEWKIMRILWRNNARGKMTFGEIQEALKSEVSWNVNTIRTLLLRLAENNVVGMEKRPGQNKNYEYYAIAKEEDCAIQETKSLLERVFGGSTSLLFSTLIKNGGISPEEQEEILKVIESMKTGGDKK